MADSWTVVSALAASIAVPGALAGVVWQVRQARVAEGVNVMLQLGARFDSPEFRQARHDAAAALMSTPDEYIDDVVDFFETVGLLTRRGVLNDEVIWSEFSYWVFGYWLYAKSYIRRHRQGDPLRWTEIEWLYHRLFWIEYRKRRPLYFRLVPLWLHKILRPRDHGRTVRLVIRQMRVATLDLAREELALAEPPSRRGAPSLSGSDANERPRLS